MRINLKAAVLRSGLTQYQVAQQVEMNESRFSRIMSGRISPTAEERIAIARILNVPLELSSALWDPQQKVRSEHAMQNAVAKVAAPNTSLDLESLRKDHPQVVEAIEGVFAQADLKLRFILLRLASERLGKEALTQELKALNQRTAEVLLLDLLELEIRHRRHQIEQQKRAEGA